MSTRQVLEPLTENDCEDDEYQDEVDRPTTSAVYSAGSCHLISGCFITDQSSKRSESDEAPLSSSNVTSLPKFPPLSPMSSSPVEDDNDMRIVLVGVCSSDDNLLSAAKKLDVADVVTSMDGLDYMHMASMHETFFVLQEFEGPVYRKLRKAEARIIGPPVVFWCQRNDEPLPFRNRPLFAMSMWKSVILIKGFEDQKRAHVRYGDIVHKLSGGLRKDITPTVTHLVTNCTSGDSYKFAMTMGLPIMSADWLQRLWNERNNIEISVNSEDVLLLLWYDAYQLAEYKLKPFHDLCLSFFGFSPDEQSHMEELTTQNGGKHGPIGSEGLTHLVVDDVSVKDLPSLMACPKYIVRGEPMEDSSYSTSSTSLHARSRKRKRLKQLAAEGEVGSPFGPKRRSAESSNISVNLNSFLDASYTPERSNLSHDSLENVESKPSISSAKPSKRMHVAMELLQTETNYNSILHILLNTFKEQIENPEQCGGALLAPQDIKIIFGNIPLIHRVHSKVKADLTELLEMWTESACIGDIILKHAEGFLQAYPTFINFFENIKTTIAKCDQSNPRFHAFLKVCLSKPECGRQTLQELFIRPVQRLPSVILLLGDLFKNTPSTHADKEKLEQAIECLKGVMAHINEDRRRTEGQFIMFDVINDIDRCPATLLSSHRNFVSRVDVVELTDMLVGRGTPISLFIFSDCIEICKRRAKVVGTPRSMTQHKTSQKSYKHVQELSISSIKRILDFIETDDCTNAFGVIYRPVGQPEKLLSFMMDHIDGNKEDILKSLCKTIANAFCRTDFDTVLAAVSGSEFSINTKDLVSRSIKSKISKRVSRAFSISRTPGKLKRAVSHIFSPMKAPGNGGDMKNSRKLASTLTLNEESPTSVSQFEDSDCISLGAYSLQAESSPRQHFGSVTPRSVATPKPTRSSKFATLGFHSAGDSKHRKQFHRDLGNG